MEQTKKKKEWVGNGPKKTLSELKKKAAADYPYWTLLRKKPTTDPRVVDKEHGFEFMRIPYDSHRNAWCFKNARDRARFESMFGGLSHNQHIPKPGAYQ